LNDFEPLAQPEHCRDGTNDMPSYEIIAFSYHPLIIFGCLISFTCHLSACLPKSNQESSHDSGELEAIQVLVIHPSLTNQSPFPNIFYHTSANLPHWHHVHMTISAHHLSHLRPNNPDSNCG
jgi:hypothetical protein